MPNTLAATNTNLFQFVGAMGELLFEWGFKYENFSLNICNHWILLDAFFFGT